MFFPEPLQKIRQFLDSKHPSYKKNVSHIRTFKLGKQQIFQSKQFPPP